MIKKIIRNEEKDSYKYDIEENEYSSSPPKIKPSKTKVIEPSEERNDYESSEVDVPF